MMEVELCEMTIRLGKRNQKTEQFREDIADLIAKGLTELQYTLGYWEKAYYKLAIHNLKKNIWLLDEDSTTYLGTCLLCIEGAHVAVQDRSIAFTTRDIETEALTWEDLMASVEQIRVKVH